MGFIEYLYQKNTPGTIKRYQREIEVFFFSIEKPETANYQQIMDYLGKTRKEKNDVNVGLYAIKKYYNYLVSIGIRKDNPAQSIKLRDRKSRDIQLQDLFKPEELEQLLERKERYAILKNRNKIIISLLVYQGLTNGEIKELELKDIDLEQGTVYIKAGRKTNNRTLKLRSNQVYWLVNYLQNDRSKLIKIESQNLIISKLGTEETGEGISYLIESSKHLFTPVGAHVPERKLNPKTIRQSVIANLLKQGKDLRLVQAFVGHKYPSATEKYKQSGIEELKAGIEKYHPLGYGALAK